MPEPRDAWTIHWQARGRPSRATDVADLRCRSVLNIGERVTPSRPVPATARIAFCPVSFCPVSFCPVSFSSGKPSPRFAIRPVG